VCAPPQATCDARAAVQVHLGRTQRDPREPGADLALGVAAPAAERPAVQGAAVRAAGADAAGLVRERDLDGHGPAQGDEPVLLLIVQAPGERLVARDRRAEPAAERHGRDGGRVELLRGVDLVGIHGADLASLVVAPAIEAAILGERADMGLVAALADEDARDVRQAGDLLGGHHGGGGAGAELPGVAPSPAVDVALREHGATGAAAGRDVHRIVAAPVHAGVAADGAAHAAVVRVGVRVDARRAALRGSARADAHAHGACLGRRAIRIVHAPAGDRHGGGGRAGGGGAAGAAGARGAGGGRGGGAAGAAGAARGGGAAGAAGCPGAAGAARAAAAGVSGGLGGRGGGAAGAARAAGRGEGVATRGGEERHHDGRESERSNGKLGHVCSEHTTPSGARALVSVRGAGDGLGLSAKRARP
jgi:hypothetical protein